MRYIDADKLIAEIERRKKAIHSTMFNDEYDDLLSFLNTLQEPEVHESEYGPYARQYPKSEVSKEQPEVDLEKDLALTAEDVKAIFNKVRDVQVKYYATEGCYQEVADWFNENKPTVSKKEIQTI